MEQKKNLRDSNTHDLSSTVTEELSYITLPKHRLVDLVHDPAGEAFSCMTEALDSTKDDLHHTFWQLCLCR